MVDRRGDVRVFQTLETENSYYMAMELCAGGDLMDKICEKKRLEEREVRRYIRQILSAVDHLHNYGIVHRSDHNRRVRLRLVALYLFHCYLSLFHRCQTAPIPVHSSCSMSGSDSCVTRRAVGSFSLNSILACVDPISTHTHTHIVFRVLGSGLRVWLL